MNRQLKRIKQTLQHLEQDPSAHLRSTGATAELDRPATPTPAPQPPISFNLYTEAVASSRERDSLARTATEIVAEANPEPTKQSPVQPFHTRATGEDCVPKIQFNLPNFSKPSHSSHNLGFSRHQNGANPDLALNLLQETLHMLQAWRTELQQIIEAIQAIYREGPIVDGWLECSTQKVEATTSVLRNAEVTQLMDYVETLCEDPSKTEPEYHLCGLSADGRIWSTPCPPAQLAGLSLAIARHHKLQPLLQRKFTLEKHLSDAAEATAKFHSQMQRMA